MPSKQPPLLTDKTKTVLRALLAAPEKHRSATDLARDVALPPTVTASLLARLINMQLVTDFRVNGERMYRIVTGAEAVAAQAADVPAPVDDRSPAPAAAPSEGAPRPERGVWRLRDLRAAVDRGDMPRGVLDAAERVVHAPPADPPVGESPAQGSATRPGKSTRP
jgi:hypothetical protein